jgi:hypothetical protein
VPISRLTLKDQHRAETNQSETRSLNERKRLAEIKRGKPCKNDERDDFLYALQLGGRVDRVADPIGRHRETIFNKGNTPAHQNAEHHGPQWGWPEPKGEFTHVGDMCSFEVLLERIGLNDSALHAIGEIVHDIDLKDGKFGREQVPGLAHVIAGICASQKDDLARIERGSRLFDDTYEYFRKKRVDES